MSSKYCNSAEWCANAGWCAADYKPKGQCVFFVRVTNYQRMHLSNPPELAKFLATLSDPKWHIVGNKFDATKPTEKEWLRWLNGPADETKRCFWCQRSMSADGDDGEPHLVCSMKGHAKVSETFCCDDYC